MRDGQLVSVDAVNDMGGATVSGRQGLRAMGEVTGRLTALKGRVAGTTDTLDGLDHRLAGLELEAWRLIRMSARTG